MHEQIEWQGFICSIVKQRYVLEKDRKSEREREKKEITYTHTKEGPKMASENAYFYYNFFS